MNAEFNRPGEKESEEHTLSQREKAVEYVLTNRDIDPAAKPVLARLCKLGLITTGCCSGHTEQDKIRSKWPFITWNNSNSLEGEEDLQIRVKKALEKVRTNKFSPEEMAFDKDEAEQVIDYDSYYSTDHDPGDSLPFTTSTTKIGSGSSHPHLDVHSFDFGVTWRPTSHNEIKISDLQELWRKIQLSLDEFDHEGTKEIPVDDFREPPTRSS